MSYIDDAEQALFEELLHRVQDATEYDASGALPFLKKQADRITEYRADKERVSEDRLLVGAVKP